MTSWGGPLMSAPALVFVHSPLVGPLSWQPVADRFIAAGWAATVPDFRSVLGGAPPYQPAVARAVARAAEALPQPPVLIGHSGAGPLLPGIAAAMSGPARALIYVDAGLPYPGQSWWQTAPPELTAQLSGLAAGGWLPPWHEWFPSEALATSLPDPQLRARFTGQLGSLPLAFFHEPTSTASWPGPAGYLLLSEVYRAEARAAAELGMPVVEHPSDHLAPVTAPEAVAGALRDLLLLAVHRVG